MQDTTLETQEVNLLETSGILTTPPVTSEVTRFFSTDVGSTSTRTMRFTTDLEETEVLEIPADYTSIQQNISYIKSSSDKLIDNMEIIIKDITPTPTKPEKVFHEKRIVKGTLFQALKLPAEKPISGVLKSRQESTFVNWITSIGLWSYIRAAMAIEHPTKLIADVTIAIPPEDKKSTKNIEYMQERFFGTYLFELPRLGYSLTINVPRERILIEDEASANIRCYGSGEDVDISEYTNILCGDAGGRSDDTGLMQNGVLIPSATKTGRFGGESKFLQFIANSYADEFGEEPPYEVIKSSLDTGIATDAARTDFTKHIKSAKKELAKLIWQEFVVVMDLASLRPTQINLVILAGKLYKETIRGGRVTVPSMSEDVAALFKAASPKTEIAVIQQDNPIVWGLAFYRISEL